MVDRNAKLDVVLDGLIEIAAEDSEKADDMRFYALGLVEGCRGILPPKQIRKRLWDVMTQFRPGNLYSTEGMCGTGHEDIETRRREKEELILSFYPPKTRAEWLMARGRIITFLRDAPFREIGDEQEFALASNGRVMSRPLGSGNSWDPFFKWVSQVQEQHAFQRIDTVPPRKRFSEIQGRKEDNE